MHNLPPHPIDLGFHYLRSSWVLHLLPLFFFSAHLHLPTASWGNSLSHIWVDIFKAKPKFTLLLPKTVSNWNQITKMIEWALHGRAPPNSQTLSSTFPSSTHTPCLSSKLKDLLSWTCWAASNLCVLAPSDGVPCPLQTFQETLHLASFHLKAMQASEVLFLLCILFVPHTYCYLGFHGAVWLWLYACVLSFYNIECPLKQRPYFIHS